MRTELKTVTFVTDGLGREAPLYISDIGWRVLSHSRYDGTGSFTIGKTWHTLVLAREVSDGDDDRTDA